MNLNYLTSQYMMVYCDIIKPIPVGGVYRKVQKIVPMETSQQNYINHYFKHKEFHDLEITEIDSIHIQLATHDGEEVEFANTQDLIVNLEFSNYNT